MSKKLFKDWLDKLKTAWETKSPELAAEICAEKLIWQETPFEKPLTTRKKVLDEWQSVLKHKNVSVSYDILCTNSNTAFAHWSASFTRIPSNKKTELDGIFMFKLNKKGLCVEFRQWYNSK